MINFGPAAVVGLCFGFLWGIGCSLAVLYSIYLGGYRKAVKDSLSKKKSLRYQQVLEKVLAKRARAAAAATEAATPK